MDRWKLRSPNDNLVVNLQAILCINQVHQSQLRQIYVHSGLLQIYECVCIVCNQLLMKAPEKKVTKNKAGLTSREDENQVGDNKLITVTESMYNKPNYCIPVGWKVPAWIQTKRCKKGRKGWAR